MPKVLWTLVEHTWFCALYVVAIVVHLTKDLWARFQHWRRPPRRTMTYLELVRYIDILRAGPPGMSDDEITRQILLMLGNQHKYAGALPTDGELARLLRILRDQQIERARLAAADAAARAKSERDRAAGLRGSAMQAERNRPAEVMVDGDQAFLVRARETVDEQLRLETLLP